MAETNPFTPPLEIVAALGCLVFLLMLYNQGMKAARNFRGREPQPPNETLGQSFADLERRVGELERRHDLLIAKLDHDKSEVMAAGSARSEKTHLRINEVLAAVSRLDGKILSLRDIVDNLHRERH